MQLLWDAKLNCELLEIREKVAGSFACWLLFECSMKKVHIPKDVLGFCIRNICNHRRKPSLFLKHQWFRSSGQHRWFRLDPPFTIIWLLLIIIMKPIHCDRNWLLSRIRRFNHVTLQLSKKATVVQTNPKSGTPPIPNVSSETIQQNYMRIILQTSHSLNPDDCIVCNDTPQLMARCTKLTQSRLNLRELSAANHLANKFLVQMNISNFE